MRNLCRFALLAAVAVALVMPGALAAGGRKMMTLSPGKRLVNAQVHLDKKQYQAQVTQAVTRQEAINKVGKTLDKAAKRDAHLDSKVDAAADRAAMLQAKASHTGSIFAMKQAALAEVNVEKVIRHVEREKDQLQDKVDRKIQNTLQWQAKKEDRAEGRIDRAEFRADKAAANFDRFLVRKGASGGPGPQLPPFGGPQGPALGGGGGGFGGGDYDGGNPGLPGGPMPLQMPNLPFLP